MRDCYFNCAAGTDVRRRSGVHPVGIKGSPLLLGIDAIEQRPPSSSILVENLLEKEFSFRSRMISPPLTEPDSDLLRLTLYV